MSMWKAQTYVRTGSPRFGGLLQNLLPGPLPTLFAATTTFKVLVIAEKPEIRLASLHSEFVGEYGGQHRGCCQAAGLAGLRQYSFPHY